LAVNFAKLPNLLLRKEEATRLHLHNLRPTESIARREGCSVRKVNMTISLALTLSERPLRVGSHTAWELFASPNCRRNGPASANCSTFRLNSHTFEPKETMCYPEIIEEIIRPMPPGLSHCGMALAAGVGTF
jgi:hypothetical protein